MKTVLKEARERMQKSYEAFESSVATVRTGRANPQILNRIQVEYYGTRMPLNQVANISSPDPRTLMITPFDKSVINEIERAIRESDLGFNPNNQGDAVFITVPALNDERRRELVKAVKHMAEEAKVAMRTTSSSRWNARTSSPRTTCDSARSRSRSSPTSTPRRSTSA